MFVRRGVSAVGGYFVPGIALPDARVGCRTRIRLQIHICPLQVQFESDKFNIFLEKSKKISRFEILHCFYASELGWFDVIPEQSMVLDFDQRDSKVHLLFYWKYIYQKKLFGKHPLILYVRIRDVFSSKVQSFEILTLLEITVNFSFFSNFWWNIRT